MLLSLFATLALAITGCLATMQCNADNCLRAVQDAKFSTASAYCSSFLSQTATVTTRLPTNLASSCKTSNPRVSSACACYLASPSSTTITVSSLSTPVSASAPVFSTCPSACITTTTITYTYTPVATTDQASISKAQAPPAPSANSGITAKIEPYIFIISLFTPEGAVWPDPLVLTNDITVPGFSPLFPAAHCNGDGTICQVTAGEGEINAASTISALIQSPYFDLAKSYFLIGGIAGINPACGTLGSVALAHYSVQVGLEYQIDSRELETNYTSGEIPLGSKSPAGYPSFLYGTEVFELSTALRDRAYSAAENAILEDDPSAIQYRQLYPDAPANRPPSVIKGHVATSDAFWHGQLLGETYAQYVSLLTNNSGQYCMTAQEDNAILAAMVRGAISKLVDFTRIILMRTAANFDRPPPGESASQQLLYIDQGGFNEAVNNIYNAGRPIVDDIVNNWERVYGPGVPAVNFVGDDFGNPTGQAFVADIGSADHQEG